MKKLTGTPIILNDNNNEQAAMPSRVNAQNEDIYNSFGRADTAIVK